AGLSFTDLHSEAFTSLAKHAELAALLEAYECELARQNRADDAIVLRTAITASGKLPVTPRGQVLELPGCCRSMLERAFADSLPWRRRRFRVTRAPGAIPPEVWRRLNPSVEEVPTPATAASDAARLAWIAE